MTDSGPDIIEAERKRLWEQSGILAAVCALVIGVYAYIAHSGHVVSRDVNPGDEYYNLLVQGFRAGQLSLKKEVPVGLARLADPYNPTANARFRYVSDNLHDLSYYRGKLYLYYGVTPALILFWPFVALTGHFLSERLAVTVFCAVGFLVSVGLLRALWRRHFSEVSIWVVAAGVLALGLATAVPVMLPRSAYNEVAVGCGYMLTMLALAAIWCALHEPERRCRWLTAASLAYGLAAGARPSLLFGAVILLVPVAQTRRERKRFWHELAAATVPIALVGLGLMLYNELRFENPFEFGLHYALATFRSITRDYFLPHYLWFNFRIYFLEPAHWGMRFPFVHEIAASPKPTGYGRIEVPFGVLANTPLVWLALVAPLAWRWRSAETRPFQLKAFAIAVALLFAGCVLPLGFFESSAVRYEVDFLPGLVLLGLIGILGLERALASRGVARLVVRLGWVLLLAFSVAFNLLWTVAYYAVKYNELAYGRLVNGSFQEAIKFHERALQIDPYLSEAYNDLGMTLGRLGKPVEAMEQFELALRANPELADAHNNLGVALLRQGRLQEATEHFQQALRTDPNHAEACANLGLALQMSGKVSEAIEHYEQALRIRPDFSDTHYDLGGAYILLGRVQDAISQWQQTVQLQPDRVDAQYNLGLALEKMGRTTEAIEHYQQALRINPDMAAVSNALARLQARP
jgi:tetratricopeptide (TPR) repeat protein